MWVLRNKLNGLRLGFDTEAEAVHWKKSVWDRRHGEDNCEVVHAPTLTTINDYPDAPDSR